MATINVALIGQGFMGRSHSNAWGQVAKFFKPPLVPVMHTVFGQPEETPRAFAENWAWKNVSTDWTALIRSPEIGLVDIVMPNYMHAPVAKAATEAAKLVFHQLLITRPGQDTWTMGTLVSMPSQGWRDEPSRLSTCEEILLVSGMVLLAVGLIVMLLRWRRTPGRPSRPSADQTSRRLDLATLQHAREVMSSLGRTASPERKPHYDCLVHALSRLEEIETGKSQVTADEKKDLLVTMYYHRLCLCGGLADDARVAGILKTWQPVERYLSRKGDKSNYLPFLGKRQKGEEPSSHASSYRRPREPRLPGSVHHTPGASDRSRHPV